MKVLIAALLFITTSVFANDPAPTDVLKKSSLFLRKNPNIQLEFTSKVHYEITGETQNYKGELFLSTDDKFKILLQDLDYYSNGVTIWEHHKTNNQVLIKSLLDLSTGFHPSEILFKYLQCEALSVAKEKIGSRSVLALKLNPNKQLAYLEEMYVWLDEKTYAPVKLKTVDNSKNVTIYNISSFSNSVTFTDKDFEFTPGKDLEVFDMR